MRARTAVRVCTAATIVVAAADSARAETYRVPSDHSTIQGALDVSSVGDTVLVAPGTYSNWTLFNGSAVVAVVPDGVALVSEAGPAQTVVDLAPLEGAASGYGAFVHWAHASGQTVIDGFRVTGFPPLSAGVSGSYSSGLVEVRNCVFEVDGPLEPSIYRVGFSNRESQIRAVNCAFVRCSSPVSGVIAQVGGSLTVEASMFIEYSKRGIYISGNVGTGPRSLTVRDCLFRDAVPDVGGVGIQATLMVDGVTIDGCRFENLAGGLGAISLSGQHAKTITNCVFHDIELPTGSGGCVELLGGSCTVVGNTMTYCHQVWGSGAAAYAYAFSDLVFERNIVAGTSGVPALGFDDGGPVTMNCNVFWENAAGIGHALGMTDQIVDPQFCDAEGRDLTLESTSPCLPSYSLGCDLIGALGQGCGSVSVESESWAKVKAAFRDTSRDGREDGKE